MADSISPKEFLTQAEQKYGKWAGRVIKLILLGGIGIPLIFLLPAILATLTLATAVVGKAIVLGVLCAVAGTLWTIASSPRVRAMWHDQIDGLIESMTKWSITINPIDRLNAYANEYLQGKLNLIESVRQQIREKQNWHRDQVEKKSAELEKLLGQAVARKRRSCVDEAVNKWKDTDQGREDHDEFRLLSDQINLLKESLVRLEKMGKRYELFMTLLEKFSRTFDLSIRKIRNTVQVVTDEYEASQNMAEATQAMSGVMNETDERTKLFNMTLDYVSAQIAGNVAQVENYFDQTRTIIGSADLDSDVAEENLLKELSTMGDKTDQAISVLEAQGTPSMRDVVAHVRAADSADMNVRVAASSPSGDNKYAELLRKVNRN